MPRNAKSHRENERLHATDPKFRATDPGPTPTLGQWMTSAATMARGGGRIAADASGTQQRGSEGSTKEHSPGEGEAPDPAIPRGFVRFLPTRDTYGVRLALVFGNENRDGRCPFYGRSCYHCDIGAGEGIQFTPKMNERRLDEVRKIYHGILPTVAHLVLYNSGSLFNPAETSRKTLGRLLDFATSLALCQTVSIDSREIYVTDGALECLLEHLPANQKGRVILGLETQDDDLRTKILKKPMSRRGFERAAAMLQSGGRNLGLDVNILFQPPGTTPKTAVREAVATARYALEVSEKWSLALDLNFHPYYRSQVGRRHFPHHPRARLPQAVEALLRIREILDQSELGGQIYIGWQDEEHDGEPDERARELNSWLARFSAFNQSQEASCLA